MQAKINPDDVDILIYCVDRPFYTWLKEQRHLSHRFTRDVRRYLKLGLRGMPTNMNGRCVNHYRCTHMAYEDYLHGLTPKAIADKVRMTAYNKRYAKAATKGRRKKK